MTPGCATEGASLEVEVMSTRRYPETVDGSSLTGRHAVQPGERPECAVHHRPMVCPSCIGAAGGRKRSERKTMTARLNAMRPRPGRSVLVRRASDGRLVATGDAMAPTRKAALTRRSGARKLAATTKTIARAKKRPTKQAARKSKDVRELLTGTASGSHYARRRQTNRTGPKGSFKTMVSVSKSLAADRRKKAATKVAKGQGDRGDVG